MEGRQEHQVPALRRQSHHHGGLDGVEDAHLMGDLRALRPAGRSRGVHDGPDVAEIGHRRLQGTARGGQARFVGAGFAVREVGKVRHARELRHLQCCIGELHAVDQHKGARVLGDELELGHREAPVQRQKDRSQPPAGELKLEDVGVVHTEDGHAIAGADAEITRQPQRAARDALVELGIGEAPAGRQVVGCFRLRREARVVGDPVLCRNTRRHAFPLFFMSPELQAGVGLCPSQRPLPHCTSKVVFVRSASPGGALAAMSGARQIPRLCSRRL